MAPMYFRLHKYVNSKLFDDLGSLPVKDQNLPRSHFWVIPRVTCMTSLVAIVTKTFFQKKLKLFTPFERALKIDEKSITPCSKNKPLKSYTNFNILIKPGVKFNKKTIYIRKICLKNIKNHILIHCLSLNNVTYQ